MKRPPHKSNPPHPSPLPVGEREKKSPRSNEPVTHIIPRPKGERKASLRAGEGEYRPKPSPALRSNAKKLRSDSTEVEKLLWSKLRNRQLAGVKFRRQFPIDSYIADFAAPEHHLIIELDGGQHNDPSAQAYDAARSAFLQKSGWHVLRFWNNDVNENIEGVLETIAQALTRKD